jgi:hypothetical protein
LRFAEALSEEKKSDQLFKSICYCDYFVAQSPFQPVHGGFDSGSQLITKKGESDMLFLLMA